MRTFLHLERQGHRKNVFHATAYSEAVTGDRSADSGPRAGAGESLPKVFPATCPSVVGCQFQGVSMATLMLIREHCQICEHMLRWRASLQEKGWYSVASWKGQRETFLARDHIR